MKIIFLSVSPAAPTGYGLVTRNLVPRFQAEGHEVIVATKHFHVGDIEWNGMHIIQGLDVNILNRMVDRGEYDCIFTLLDNHALPQIPHNWVAYTPFDTERIPESMSRTLPHAQLIVAMTKHGQREIERIGYEPMYAPHGVDTEVYSPNDAKRLEGRMLLGWQDNFVIGCVGVNYDDDRKNLVNLVRAFKVFHQRHDEARLYLSSNPISTDGSDYLPRCIDNLGLNQVVQWAEPDRYFLGRVSDETMANRYRMMDVMCFPTRGEGFGLPLIEAQACGVPVITTGASTGPELCPTQYLIPVSDAEWQWYNKEWRANVNSESILAALEQAYADPERALVAQAGPGFARDYDWDTVFDRYWKPVLAAMEGLKTRVRRTPDYRRLFEAFTGRIAMSDCGDWCGNICPKSFDLLPGERASERPCLSRSYPVMPDLDGRLLVDTRCPMHKWLSKQFKQQVKEAWEYLWGFPVIRQFVADSLANTHMFQSSASTEPPPVPPLIVASHNWVPLDSLKPEFNEEYKWAMQSRYKTNAPDISPWLDGTALEVGCGDGARVLALREKGVDAIGVEVNPAHHSEFVWPGDAEHLDFPDNHFATVYSVDVLEHLEHPLKALSEMFRVSKRYVINSITPSEDASFWQDPTHKVEWDKARWMREIDAFGEVKAVLEPFTVVAKKGTVIE